MFQLLQTFTKNPGTYLRPSGIMYFLLRIRHTPNRRIPFLLTYRCSSSPTFTYTLQVRTFSNDVNLYTRTFSRVGLEVSCVSVSTPLTVVVLVTFSMSLTSFSVDVLVLSLGRRYTTWSTRTTGSLFRLRVDGLVPGDPSRPRSPVPRVINLSCGSRGN